MSRQNGILGISLLALGLWASCGDDGIERKVSAQLQPLSDCAQVEQAMRQAAIAQMNLRIDAALQSALEGDCYYGGWDMDAGLQNGRAPAAPSPGAPSEGGAKQASGTNNQVQGVDEADFVKNDNEFIYVLSKKHLRIIDAWPPESAQELSAVEIEGEAKKLYVHADRALVYSSLGDDDASQPGGWYGGECTYGYNCSFTGDGHPTKITVFDISDRSAPKLLREIRLSGSYVNARRIDDAVYTVISSPGVSFPGLEYWVDVGTCDGPFAWLGRTQQELIAIVNAYEALRAKNKQIIMTTPIEDWLPSIEDTIHVGPNKGQSSELLAACGGFYASSIADGSQLTTLLALDMTADEAASAASIVSRPGAVYAAAGALYISVPHERAGGMWYRGMDAVKEASTVHKFALSPATAAVRYVGSGVVKGRVLNQFAMDEKDGHLRIATSNGHVPSPDVHSTLTVLAEHNAGLVQVGIVDQLAPKEDIRSVRFDGDRGFIVTFKKTDPLFVLDLSNPKSPEVLAELKIPGFSTYMHLMDKDHLLTIGYDADDQGSFAWFTGVMLQIFDISDPTTPKLAHKEVIGTRGSSSEALNNHLAFTYFAPKEVLALPMTVCEGGSGGGSYGDTMTFSGLMVYNVTASAGFSLRGKVAHPAGEGVSCSNWWTNANSQVKRSIVMDDYVFSISDELIKANHLDDLPVDVASISIAD